MQILMYSRWIYLVRLIGVDLSEKAVIQIDWDKEQLRRCVTWYKRLQKWRIW